MSSNRYVLFFIISLVLLLLLKKVISAIHTLQGIGRFFVSYELYIFLDTSILIAISSLDIPMCARSTGKSLTNYIEHNSFFTVDTISCMLSSFS